MAAVWHRQPIPEEIDHYHQGTACERVRGQRGAAKDHPGPAQGGVDRMVRMAEMRASPRRHLEPRGAEPGRPVAGRVEEGDVVLMQERAGRDHRRVRVPSGELRRHHRRKPLLHQGDRGQPGIVGVAEANGDIDLVALYRGDLRGPYLEGIQQALKTHALGSRVKLVERPYGDEDRAFYFAEKSKAVLLLDDMVRERGMGLILISHDLNLVASFCDRVLVMYGGRVVEVLEAGDLSNAQHPYTKGLLNCLPELDRPQDVLPVLQRDPAWLD